MTEQEYNAAEGIRRSDLWIMKDSPEKFRWHMDHPEEESEKSPAFLFGSAAHKYVLEPETWDLEYAVAPNIDKRTKAGREEWESFVQSNGMKTIIGQDSFDTICEMASAIPRTSLAKEMLTGQHEVPFFWTDPDTGEKCKCKADVLKQTDGKYVVVDYKTATDASTETFNKHIFKYGYHVQAAMYTDGLRNAIQLDYRPKFFFVVQEKKAPYAVNVIEVSDEVMQYGDTVYHELMRKYNECNEMDLWPGYVEDVPNDSWLPGWVDPEFEEE